MSTQIPSPVSVGNQVEVVVPNQAIAPVGYSGRLQSLHPGYQYQNPIAFRTNFLSNTEFRTKYVDDLFEQRLAVDPNAAAFAEQNPDEQRTKRANAEARMLNRLYAEVSTGEDMIDAISRRGAEMTAMQFNPARTPDYVNTVRAFPQHYEDFKVTDGKNLLADFESNPELIGQLVKTDPEFRDKVYRDRFNLFYQALGTSHNRHGVNTGDIDEITKAFAIFENYGSEGLTRYVNYFQNYNP
jgi:hypothetical protein